MYPITMKRKRKRESTENDIGFAGPDQFEAIAEEGEDEEEDEYERDWCL